MNECRGRVIQNGLGFVARKVRAKEPPRPLSLSILFCNLIFLGRLIDHFLNTINSLHRGINSSKVLRFKVNSTNISPKMSKSR